MMSEFPLSQLVTRNEFSPMSRRRSILRPAASLATAGLIAAALAVTVPSYAAATTHTISVGDAGLTQQFYSGDWDAGAIGTDVTSVTIEFPADMPALDLGVDYFGVVYLAGSYIEIPVTPTATNVTLPVTPGSLVEGGAGYYFSFYPTTAFTSSTADSTVLTVNFTVNSAANVGASISINTDEIDKNYSYIDYYLQFDPTITVSAGDSIDVVAPTGYFTDGPAGTWVAGPETSVAGFSSSPFELAPPSESIGTSGDGSASQASFTIPAPHWSFTGPVYAFATVGDSSSYVNMSFILDYGTPSPPTVGRVAGSDRFAVAQQIAIDSYPTGATTVFVTNGLNYPDALSASPVAAALGGPLLLTYPWELPSGFVSTVETLNPTSIVVVGGPNSVSASVYSALEDLIGSANVQRLGGTDRFDASRNLARFAFEAGGSSVAYLATGLNFPDALSASAVAGVLSAPVILVNGGLPEADAATVQLLIDLGVSDVRIAGGPNSVSSGYFDSLMDAGFDTSRLSGSDRFEASSNIARGGFGQASEVFLATGFNFPDALAGAAWAASVGAPLIVIPGNCIPQRVLDDLVGYQVEKVTILGGPNSVSVAVESLTACAGFEWPDGDSAPTFGPVGSVAGPTVDRLIVDQWRQRVEAQR